MPCGVRVKGARPRLREDMCEGLDFQMTRARPASLSQAGRPSKGHQPATPTPVSARTQSTAGFLQCGRGLEGEFSAVQLR